MASKRSRVVRSSSQGEIWLYSHIRPLDPPEPRWEPKRYQPQKPPKNSNPAAVAVSKRPQKLNVQQLEQPQPQQPRRSIFRLNSPTTVEMNDFVFKEQTDEGFRAFLKCCSLCKKQLKEDKDVYMYGYLTAFCSPRCREDQMALDGFDNKIKECEAIRKKANLGR